MNKIDNSVRIAQIMGKWIGGGVESVVMNYYRHIDRDKIQFDFICDDDSTDIPYDEIKKLGGKVILIPPYQKVFSYHFKLKKVLKDGGYKIVHSHINTLSVFSLFAAKCAGVPVRIAHSHSTTNKKEKKKNLLKQVLRPFSKVFATDYMCCSELAGRWLFGDKEYDKGNVYLLNNAIDLDKFKYDEKIRRAKRKELNIADDTLVIGHVGRFVEQKNHRFLIDIFNEVHKQNENSILLLVGQGPLMAEIKEKVKKLGLEKYVKFLGQRNDVNMLYQAFDVFLLPSLYEGLPVVGVEAQATGLLCIFSDDMTKETKVLSTTKFLSLEMSSKGWSDFIIEKSKNFQRADSKEEIAKNNFDINVESKKLENKYLSFYEKKILFTCHSLTSGGAERVICNLSNYLNQKNKVYITTLFDRPIAYKLDNDVVIKSCKLKKDNIIGKISNAFEIINTIKNISPNYVISFCPTMCFITCFFRIFNKKLKKCKLIVSERNNPENEYKNNVMKKIANFLYSKADVIVFQTKDAMYFFDEKVRKKGVIIPNPINEKFIDYDNRTIEKENIIVNVGRLTIQKNQKNLILAFSKIIKIHADYKLYIYGVGELENELKKLIKEQKLEKKVFLKGTSQDLATELSKCKIFVLSSDFEGMPNALMEAMSLGMACISTDCPCGGPKELISNYENGLLVPTNDFVLLANRINELIENDDLRQKIENNAKKIIITYNPKAIYKKWENLL